MKNRTILAALSLLAPVALIPACSRNPNGKGIRASGHIEATEVRLSAKVGGRLVSLPFREGDRVKNGEVVARLDPSDAQRELERAKAERAGADARLRLLLAGARSEDLTRAEAEVGRMEAELQGAQLDLGRLEGLAERGTATLKARDDARTRASVLSRTVAAGRAELAKLRAGARPEEVQLARAQLAGTEASVAAIEQRMTDLAVIAPVDGVITQRNAEPGEVLPAGAPLSVLTELNHPWLTVYVDQPSLSRVKLGDPVVVRVDGRSEAFAGKVAFVSEVAEFTPKNVQTPEERAKLVFKVKVALENASGVFKPGLPADAELAAEAAK